MPHALFVSRQPVIARAAGWLCRWCGWCCPWLALEVEKLAYVHPSGIAMIKVRQTKPGFDHLQYSGAVGHVCDT